ncbi:MAG: YdcF family protein [Bacteroidales bacterium]
MAFKSVGGLRRILIFLKGLTFGLGILALLMGVLSFTSLPFWAWYRLGKAGNKSCQPVYIVVMGAGGMPGPEGLMRCYYTALAARKFPHAKVIVALPVDFRYFEDSHPQRMARELILRGVDSTRIMYELKGINTRSQALNIKQMLGSDTTSCLMVITSPEHTYRSVATFRKLGFRNVSSMASFSSELPADHLLPNGKDSVLETTPDNWPLLRYDFWNYLKLEITVLREYIAIAWYWLKGWI